MNTSKYLLLQSRPEIEAADNEFEAFCQFGGLVPADVQRVRMDQGDLPDINLDDYAAVIMGGGPANFAYDETAKSKMQRTFEPWLFGLLQQIIATDKPFLGACLGFGALVKCLGGEVSFKYSEPVEAVDVLVSHQGESDPLLQGLPAIFSAFVGHKEGVYEAPFGSVELARSSACSQMIRIGQNVYATQFHPELDGLGLALRIKTYKDAGYFPADEADALVEMALNSSVEYPVQILRKFIEIYSQ